MLIEIQFQKDVPMTMAATLIKAFRDHVALFSAVDKVKVNFEDGEYERLMATENAPRK